MPQILLRDAHLHFGEILILNKACCTIKAGEKICLVGRNGAGKSTLLKVLAGEIALDSGERVVKRDLRIARLDQQVPSHEHISVFDFIARGLGETAKLLYRLSELSKEHHLLPSSLTELATLQEQLDQQRAWHFEQKISLLCEKLSLNPQQYLDELSGGQLRRAALAQSLLGDPQLLLLDEPTNHLDLASIKILEQIIRDFAGTVVFISHDRAFIRQLADTIFDLDRGAIVEYSGNYDRYLAQKTDDLRIQSEQNALFDKKLAEEERWIRQGIKARRTRNEGRVRSLKAMRKERAARLEQLGSMKIVQKDLRASGKIIFELNNASITFGTQKLLDNFTARIMRGDKIALVGNNGVGKTTFIKLLLGEITPGSGSIRQGSNLDIAYFDQHRETLDEQKSALDNLADGALDIEINGNKRHALGYLQDFLFTPKRARTPVKALSGGERNRLLLAKILLKPHNLLILDEPTNDLDVETLELLEEYCGNFKGTIIVVSHDRAFIDNIATDCYFFEGAGIVRHFVGGYTDASAQKTASDDKINEQSKGKRSENWQNLPKEKHVRIKTPSTVKLSFKEKRELAALPDQMEEIEKQIDQLENEINQSDFFQQGKAITDKKLQELAQLQEKFEQCFLQWEALEAKNNGVKNDS